MTVFEVIRKKTKITRTYPGKHKQLLIVDIKMEKDLFHLVRINVITLEKVESVIDCCTYYEDIKGKKKNNILIKLILIFLKIRFF